MAKQTNPKNAAPKPPEIKIKITHDLKVDASNNTFSLPMECSVFLDNQAVSGQQVIVKEGVNVKYTGTTDVNGTFVVLLNGKLIKTEQTRNFRFCLAGLSDEAGVVVSIPAKTSKPAEDKDPESLILDSCHDGVGNFVVRVRVLKAKGVGLNTTVNIFYRNVLHQIPTDDSGEAIFNVPGVILEGESFSLIATVSGIHDSAKLKLSRTKNLVKHPMFSHDWWRSNNGRGFALLVLTAVFWFICLKIGGGEPAVNNMTFRHETSGLSTQEEMYNRTIIEAYPEDHKEIFEAQKHDSQWQHYFWQFTLLLTLFTSIYAPLSLREEIAAGFKEGVEKLFHKSSAKADDPAYEKLAKMAGIHSAAHRPKVITATTTNAMEAPVEVKGHPTLGTLFSMDLLSDFLVEVLPSILKKVF